MKSQIHSYSTTSLDVRMMLQVRSHVYPSNVAKAAPREVGEDLKSLKPVILRRVHNSASNTRWPRQE